MLLAVLLFAVGVTCISAADPTTCGPLQRLMVEHQWDEAHGTAMEFETFWEHVWEE